MISSPASPVAALTPKARTSKWRRMRWNAPGLISGLPGSTWARVSTSASRTEPYGAVLGSPMGPMLPDSRFARRRDLEGDQRYADDVQAPRQAAERELADGLTGGADRREIAVAAGVRRCERLGNGR